MLKEVTANQIPLCVCAPLLSEPKLLGIIGFYKNESLNYSSLVSFNDFYRNRIMYYLEAGFDSYQRINLMIKANENNCIKG